MCKHKDVHIKLSSLITKLLYFNRTCICIQTMSKEKVKKCGYLENKNKRRIALTDVLQGGFLIDYSNNLCFSLLRASQLLTSCPLVCRWEINYHTANLGVTCDHQVEPPVVFRFLDCNYTITVATQIPHVPLTGSKQYRIP